LGISVGKSFYPADGLLIKKSGYTSYHLGECCVRAHEHSRDYRYCPTCKLSMRVIEEMIYMDVKFLNAKILAIDGVKV